MADRLEDELRALGRGWEREPDEATVRAIVDAARSTRKRRRVGDISVLAAAAALLTVVSVAAVVVPWVVAGDAVPPAATTTSAPPSTTYTGQPPLRTAHCEGWTSALLLTAEEVADRTPWRPPRAGTPWGEPQELRFYGIRPGEGVVIATYRVDGRAVTLERYPRTTELTLDPGSPPAVEVPLAGGPALLVEPPSETDFYVHNPDRSGSAGPVECWAPRLMWSTGDGVGYAITGRLSVEEMVALAETL